MDPVKIADADRATHASIVDEVNDSAAVHHRIDAEVKGKEK